MGIIHFSTACTFKIPLCSSSWRFEKTNNTDEQYEINIIGIINYYILYIYV